MMLVKTTIDKSDIHGIGIFTAQNIKKGDKVWEFTKGIDRIISRNLLNSLPLVQKKQVLHYCYIDNITDEIILCIDNAKFFNYSYNPNIGPSPNGKDSIALRDINIGEELTFHFYEDKIFEKKIMGILDLDNVVDRLTDIVEDIKYSKEKK